jgi:hypothetical protein
MLLANGSADNANFAAFQQLIKNRDATFAATTFVSVVTISFKKIAFLQHVLLSFT